MVILSFFLYFEPFLWSSMWGSMYCNMLKTHHDGCQRSVIVIFLFYWAFHTLFQLPYRLSQCFTVRQYFTLLENMVWIFDAIEYSTVYTSSARGSNTLTLNVGQLWLCHSSHHPPSTIRPGMRGQATSNHPMFSRVQDYKTAPPVPANFYADC